MTEERLAELLEGAALLRRLAVSVSQHVAPLFDNGGDKCDCCDTFRYAHFTQKQLRDRVDGVSERLIEIAARIERAVASNDDQFEFNRKEGET